LGKPALDDRPGPALRQVKPSGEVIEAYWVTHFSARRVGSRTPYRMAKSRREIANQGFNEVQNRHGMEHICHHETNSLLVAWLILVPALTIGRLSRLRYLHRAAHPVRTAIELVRWLWLSLSAPKAPDSSQSSGQAVAALLFSMLVAFLRPLVTRSRKSLPGNGPVC